MVSAAPRTDHGRRDVAGLLVVGLAAFLPYLGQTWEIGARELRHAEIARELALHGGIIPTLFGLDYADKPPAFHLVVAALFRLIGEPSLVWARLPSVVAALGGVLAVYGLGRRLGDRRTGWLAGLLTMACVGYQHMARLAKPDMLQVALGLGACWALAATLAERRTWWRAGGCVLTGLFAGGAVLVKGPMGVGMPVLFFVSVWICRPGWRTLRPLDVALVSGATLLMIAAWALPAWRHDHGLYLHRLLVHPDMHGEDDAPRPWWWYGPQLLIGALPFTVGLPWLLREARARNRSVGAVAALALLMAISIVPKKRPHYLLPVYPFLALAVAGAITHANDRRLQHGAALLCVGALCVGPVRWWTFAISGQAAEAKWDLAGQITQQMPPGAIFVGEDEISEAIAFRGPQFTTAQEYDADGLIAALRAHGVGTYLVLPAPAVALASRIGALVHLEAVAGFAPSPRRAWNVYRVASAILED